MDEYYEDEKSVYGIEEDIYDEEGRRALVEEDELSAEEAGFLEGYDNPNTVKCAYCGKPLMENQDNILEIVIEGNLYRFCSEDCLEEFRREKEENI